MSDQQDIKQFPDLSSKLAAPTKKSVFERQRAEAEAKKVREEAETAAVLNEFVKSFDDEETAASPAGPGFGGRPKFGNGFDAGPRAPSGPSKRHFAPGGRNSGPGSLGPTPSLSKKRGFDGSRREEVSRDKGLFAFDDATDGNSASHAFKTSDDEEDRFKENREAERAAAKPTIRLSSLPPGTSPAVIKSLISPSLTVDAVRLMPPAGPGTSGSTERRSTSAIATLAQETPATDIDTAVSALQNRYLGWGFSLSISRYLSSASLGSINASMPALNSGLSSLPFNAQPVAQDLGGLSRAPPPDVHRGGIAPPSSYNPGAFNRGPPPVQVRVSPPSDIKLIKLIHKTVENMIAHGPEFEALLMTRPQVQREERWAWIWNARSPGGIYYRWRLWEVLTGTAARSGRQTRYGIRRLFEGGAPWTEPEETLPFEFTTKFEELLSDPDYDSSDEEDSADEGGPRKQRRGFQGGRGPPPDGILDQSNDDQTYLNPMHKAKLTHLLSRLPITTAKLRKGDVARVTAFAISHAGRGAEEVVDMLVTNVLRPFCCSHHANPELRSDGIDGANDEVEGDAKDQNGPLEANPTTAIEDNSPAMQIGLHLISDMLSASSTSGVRHAWRYRSLFETALAGRHVCSFLGRLEKTLKWGRLRAEKWKRSINNIFSLWEGWCVFPASVQEKFVEEFNSPPLAKEELEEEEREKEAREKSKPMQGAKTKWKTVDHDKPPSTTAETPEDVDGEPMDEDVDGVPMDDLDGAPMEDLDGAAMNEDVDGQPMEEDEPDVLSSNNQQVEHEAPAQPPPQEDAAAKLRHKFEETKAARAKRSRVKAEDMFAEESDGD